MGKRAGFVGRVDRECVKREWKYERVWTRKNRIGKRSFEDAKPYADVIEKIKEQGITDVLFMFTGHSDMLFCDHDGANAEYFKKLVWEASQVDGMIRISVFKSVCHCGNMFDLNKKSSTTGSNRWVKTRTDTQKMLNKEISNKSEHCTCGWDGPSWKEHK